MTWLGDAWQWLSDSSGALTALATVATAAFAVWAIVNAGRDSRDRSRPMVIAEFRHAEQSDTAVDLVVRNAGMSMARHASVTFDPGFGGDRDDRLSAFIVRRYAAPISGLAPGQAFRNVWWAGHMVAGSSDLQNAVATPDQVSVTVSYGDDRGRRYSDTFVLDVRDLLRETYSEASTSLKARLRTIDASLGTASKALQSIALTAQSAAERARRGDSEESAD